MAKVSDTVPGELQAEVDAAVAWYNQRQPQSFEVTGIVDADKSLQSTEPRPLHLVLCGGDTCQRQDFLLSSTHAGFDIRLIEDDTQAAAGEPQAELDPPPGARRNWLDNAVERHAFTLLLFYRGFW